MARSSIAEPSLNLHSPSSLPNEYDDDAVVNPSANAHMADVLAARLSRRQTLRGGLSVTAAALLGGVGLTACSSDDSPAPTPAPVPPPAPAPTPAGPPKLGFAAVAKNKNDLVTVAEGYQVSILHALGDPMHFGDESWKDDGSETADSYQRRIGDGHDGMYYFGLSDAGVYQADRSDRGLLCVNHEYVVAPFGLHPAGRTAGAARNASEVEKEIYAHGVSVVELKRDTAGVAMVRGSRFNRRVTSATTMDFTGPAKGSAQLATKFSAGGTQTRGTNNNCANGYTPWGTYLTCEENFLNVISRAALGVVARSAKEVASLNRYGLPQNRKSPYL
ncbi:phosphatase, partial [Pelomonas sp. HMWF004]